MEKKISVKEYAQIHGLSCNAVKSLINSGKFKTAEDVSGPDSIRRKYIISKDEPLPDKTCEMCGCVLGKPPIKAKYCARCKSERRRVYYNNHKEEIAVKRRDYNRTYREGHKEEIAAKRRDYYEKHKEELTAKSRAYFEEHKEEKALKNRDYSRAYYQSHKEEIAARKHAYYINRKKEIKSKKEGPSPRDI